MTASPYPALEKLLGSLERLLSGDQLSSVQPYKLPGLWFAPHQSTNPVSLDSPASFYIELIESLLYPGACAPAAARASNFASPLTTKVDLVSSDVAGSATLSTAEVDPTSSRPWLEDAVIYCLLARHATAYPHTDIDTSSTAGSSACHTNLRRDADESDLSWNTSGSWLKSIALLPYLQSLGINTIYLLPCMQTSMLSRKGSAGSVYAQSDIMQIDESLNEPLLQLDAETQFKAFVEAAHSLGMRVMLEFALRTTGRDARWIQEHPEWYYWVKEEFLNDAFRPPHFSDADVQRIHNKVEAHDYTDLVQPDQSYRSKFCAPPPQVEKSTDGEYIGLNADGSKCKVPGAFADYPPNDVQPLWSDVSYLRLHTNPNYAYMAYNTLRMFDAELDNERWINHGLWDCLESVIPSYIQRFDIDGAVLDMCHALPRALQQRIVHAAREAKSDFVFIEENFAVEAQSRANGFDAVLGDFWLHCTSLVECQDYVAKRNSQHPSINFLGCCDTHNSPRLFERNGRDEALQMLRLSTQCNGAIPCILAGTEFGSHQVMNTGLGFRAEELQHYPSETLPLFSWCAMDWDHADTSVISEVRKYIAERRTISKSD